MHGGVGRGVSRAPSLWAMAIKSLHHATCPRAKGSKMFELSQQTILLLGAKHSSTLTLALYTPVLAGHGVGGGYHRDQDLGLDRLVGADPNHRGFNADTANARTSRALESEKGDEEPPPALRPGKTNKIFGPFLVPLVPLDLRPPSSNEPDLGLLGDHGDMQRSCTCDVRLKGARLYAPSHAIPLRGF